jgi:hypothetical protein
LCPCKEPDALWIPNVKPLCLWLQPPGHFVSLGYILFTGFLGHINGFGNGIIVMLLKGKLMANVVRVRSFQGSFKQPA